MAYLGVFTILGRVSLALLPLLLLAEARNASRDSGRTPPEAADTQGVP